MSTKLGVYANVVAALAVMACSGALGYGLGANYTEFKIKNTESFIPKITNVQKGYVAPSRIKIYCVDLDNNGSLETLLEVDKKTYLLREIESKPVISDYVLSTSKIEVK